MTGRESENADLRLRVQALQKALRDLSLNAAKQAEMSGMRAPLSDKENKRRCWFDLQRSIREQWFLRARL